MKNNQVEVKGLQVTFRKIDDEDYISLTDIARFRESEYPSDVVRNWLRTFRTIEYLGIWEQLYNPNFNSVEFHRII